MNNQSSQEHNLCYIHNQEILLFNSAQKAHCIVCIQNMTGMIPIDTFDKQQQTILSERNQSFEEYTKYLQNLSSAIQTLKQDINLHLDKVQQSIGKELTNIQQQKKSKQYINLRINQQFSNHELQELCKKQLDLNNQGRKQIQLLFSELQEKILNINELQLLLKHTPQKQQNEQIRQPNIISKEQVIIEQNSISQCDTTEKQSQVEKSQTERKANIKHSDQTNNDSFLPLSDGILTQQLKFDSQTLQNFNNPQTQLNKDKPEIKAFAFNNDFNLLAFVGKDQIVIYQFYNIQILEKYQETLTNYGDLNCIKFMKNSNDFVTGSVLKAIIIWSLDKNSKWVAQTVLKDHDKAINCISIIFNDEVIISGSNDQKIKFWRKTNKTWGSQQTILANDIVQQISINEKEDKICMSGRSKYIQILICKSGVWSITQKIQVAEYEIKFSFTIEDQIIIKPFNNNAIILLDYENKNQSFNIISCLGLEVSEDCCLTFTCQFLKFQNILVVKHGQFLNIIKVELKKAYLVKKLKIDHQAEIFGGVTENGEYLVTWRKESQTLQINPIQIKEF